MVGVSSGALVAGRKVTKPQRVLVNVSRTAALWMPRICLGQLRLLSCPSRTFFFWINWPRFAGLFVLEAPSTCRRCREGDGPLSEALNNRGTQRLSRAEVRLRPILDFKHSRTGRK